MAGEMVRPVRGCERGIFDCGRGCRRAASIRDL